MAVKTFEQ